MKNLSVTKAVENLKHIAKSAVDELEKSLRWSHTKHGHASTSHGKYSVSATPDQNGHHTVSYTNKASGKTETAAVGSHKEALGLVVQHHLANRPPPKPRKKKDPNAPKVPKVKNEKGRPGGCPPCP
jgi:hypothetical protein